MSKNMREPELNRLNSQREPPGTFAGEGEKLGRALDEVELIARHTLRQSWLGRLILRWHDRRFGRS